MSLTRDRVIERSVSFTGQKSGLPPKTLQPSDCEIVTNYLTKRGTLKRANGDSDYGFTGGVGRVQWLERLRTRWVAQQGEKLYAETAEDSGSFLEMTGSVTNTPMISDKYRNEIYIVNGTDQKVIPSGSTLLRELGLQSPLSVNPLGSGDYTKNSSGGTFEAATYKVTLTLYNTSTNTESPGLNVRPNVYGICGDLAPDYWSITFSASDSLTINQSFINDLYANTYDGEVLIDSAQATKIRVYTTGKSTSVNADVFRLASEVTKPTSGGITITAPGTGVLFPTNNIPPPSELRQKEAYFNATTFAPPSTIGESAYTSIRFFRDSLFAVGARGRSFIKGSTDMVSFDSILYIHEPYQPDYVFDTREISNGDQQYTTAVAVLRDSVLLVFKERSIYYLSGTSVDNYVVRTMDTRRGAVSPYSVQETPFGVFALDRSGVILCDAVGEAKLVSNDVEDIIRSINFRYINSCYSGYDAEEMRYYLAVPTEESSIPNKTLVYKVDENAWSVLQGQEGASIRFGVSSDNQSRSLIGSQNGGRLARFDRETVVTVNGGIMTSEYLSGPFYCGDPTRKKKAKFVYITAESNTDWTIDVEIVPDFGQGSPQTLENINSNTLYSVYAATLADNGVNVGVFDTSLWAANKIKKQLKIPIKVVGYGFQVRVINKSTDADQYGFRILSIEVEASIMGK